MHRSLTSDHEQPASPPWCVLQPQHRSVAEVVIPYAACTTRVLHGMHSQQLVRDGRLYACGVFGVGGLISLNALAHSLALPEQP
mmetsp:Transcript_1936/g.4831  ORF Transcript_1936/g.4831 Transcript_1936/m.4831 type:complete len:84 (-) Transcript_1936:27-278(-)